MSESIAEDVYLRAARAYGLQRYNYPPDGYVSAEARERHIDNDARSTANESSIRVVVVSAYRDGQHDALCWQQPADRIIACDRAKGHKGKHSWETS